MAKLAFCGLGQMGSPMAKRLLDAGHDLTVWNRSPQKAEPLVEYGAVWASSPAEAGSGVEAAITMLATPEALEEVLFARDGLARGLDPGTTLIEMSTVGPAAISSVRERLPREVDLIDAPVLGSVPQATDGQLKVFVGGSEVACDRWMPVLEALGTPRRIGPLGSGAAMKLVVNATLVSVVSALGEALALADALGLDQPAVIEVLSDSPIGAMARSKRTNVESGTFPANFKASLALKDAGLVAAAAEEHGLDLPVARAARAWFEATREAGLGDLDYSAVIAVIRGRSPSKGSHPPERWAHG
jgi:3-hydroxyisobutyrate dehydrogenase-like beta-hydroxyacid dehydrogenase